MRQNKSAGCEGCGTPLGFDIGMAFQPIVDVRDGSVFAYEALVRGTGGESAASVLARITPANRYAFDQLCRVRAVEMGAKLGIKAKLSINFMPNAVYEPSRCLRTTLEAARRTGFPVENIIFETTEDERVHDTERLKAIFVEYRHQGFMTAIDDFGAGYAGLNLLAEFQPDIVKLDMALIRGIETDRARQTIVGGIVGICRLLGVKVIAEGVESRAEMVTLLDLGIGLMQGYLFARPGFESLPAADFSALGAQHRSGAA